MCTKPLVILKTAELTDEETEAQRDAVTSRVTRQQRDRAVKVDPGTAEPRPVARLFHFPSLAHGRCFSGSILEKMTDLIAVFVS